MEILKLDDMPVAQPYTALLYCAPGVGKSTAIGLIAEASPGLTLVLDIDRTIMRTLKKHEVVHDTSKVAVIQIDNIATFSSWSDTLVKLKEMKDAGKMEGISTIAVDNVSELERCILSDLGAQGKNKGVPAQSDYQYMQFKLVNSLRFMKTLGVNLVWTAWETMDTYTAPDGTGYSRLIPKISAKIVDNICGLCDVVGKIGVNKDGEHKILLQATQNIYAKNQIDSRKVCDVQDFAKFEIGGQE